MGLVRPVSVLVSFRVWIRGSRGARQYSSLFYLYHDCGCRCFESVRHIQHTVVELMDLPSDLAHVFIFIALSSNM